MTTDCNELWRDLSAMADAFGDLGRRLLSASRLLHAPGTLPPESLVEQIASLRLRFQELRDRTVKRAAALELRVPDEGELGSLRALGRLLEDVTDAEEYREEQEAKRKTALSILNEIAALRHIQNDFDPLKECQRRARELQTAVEAGISDQLNDEFMSLVERDHPFIYLLTMIQGNEGISDDLWDGLFESVAAAFGRPLAAAVARGRIVAENAATVPNTTNVSEASASPAVPEAKTEPLAEPVESRGISSLDLPAETKAKQDTPAPQTIVLPVLVANIPPRSTWETGEERAALVKRLKPVILGAPELEGPPFSSDDVLTSVVEEAIPFIPQSLATLLPSWRPPRPAGRRSNPKVERLEEVQLLTCNVISGYVFLDANNDGKFQTNEKAIANNTIELLNSSNVVIGTAVTDGKGYYSFSTDNTISTAPKTVSQTLTVPMQLTNFSQNLDITQFDPSLGTLTQVDVLVNGSLSTDIRIENTSISSPLTVSGTANGSLTATAPGINLTLPLSVSEGPTDLKVYDGTPDYSGSSGIDFGTKSVSDSKTVNLTSAADLTSFTGTGKVTATIAATGNVTATGGGNTNDDSKTQATGSITVVYHYTPSNCLAPGNYTIVQPTEPSGTLNGKDSRDGVVLPPTTSGPDKIPVTLAGADLPNNDFGELLPAEISGFVYEDVDKNELKSAGDLGIPNIAVQIQGIDDLGHSVSDIRTTDGNGFYDFTGLRPGTYSVSLPTQPAGYLDWFDTKGNVTPIPGSDKTDVISGIVVGQGDIAPNNNFGEIKQSGTPQGQTCTPVNITEVDRLGLHHKPTQFVVHYGADVDPTSASDLSHYKLYIEYRNGKLSKQEIPLRSAVFNPTDHTVTLTPEKTHLNIHYHYQLTISGVLDKCGMGVVGSNGLEGSNFVTVITKNNYHAVPAGPAVQSAKVASWANRFPRLAASRGIHA